jgi:hypothetical protein
MSALPSRAVILTEFGDTPDHDHIADKTPFDVQ